MSRSKTTNGVPQCDRGSVNHPETTVAWHLASDSGAAALALTQQGGSGGGVLVEPSPPLPFVCAAPFEPFPAPPASMDPVPLWSSQPLHQSNRRTHRVNRCLKSLRGYREREPRTWWEQQAVGEADAEAELRRLHGVGKRGSNDFRHQNRRSVGAYALVLGSDPNGRLCTARRGEYGRGGARSCRT